MRALGSFLRLWLVLEFSYLLLRLSFDLGVGGAVDLRTVALVEAALLPLGQAIVIWAVARPGRSSS